MEFFLSLSELFIIYFNGFQEVLNCQNNSTKTNCLAGLKILSYFTLLIPLGLATLSGAVALYGRIRKKISLSVQDQSVNNHATKKLELNVKKSFEIVQTSISRSVHAYTEDLNASQKSDIKTSFIDDANLKIEFNEVPDLQVTIRCQDIFKSGAQVIVNAANSHLGGGGGIDGAIHKQGGSDYAAAHSALKTQYKSAYVSGHASLIDSGLLRENFNISYVIVVAGPQGSTSVEKENQLYSCYYNSLVLAEEKNTTSIAFPSISTGIYHFPKDRAACISLKAIYDYTKKFPDTKLKDISIHFLPDSSKNELEIYKIAADQSPSKENE